MNRWEIARQIHRQGYGHGDENLAAPAETILAVHDALRTWLSGTAGQAAPDNVVLLDALRLVPGAHADLDRAELDITAVLRRREVSWDEIGGVFEYATPGRRQAAAARNGRLRKRYPSWTSPSTNPSPAEQEK